MVVNKTVVLFDGDIVVYRAGFAAEKRVYFDKRNPPENGGTSYPTKREALKKVKEEFLDFKRNLEPLSNALQNAKSLITNSLESLKESGYAATQYITFLSGNDEKPNFRKEVDPEYKANRDPNHKPTYLDELRKYLLTHHQGFLTQGCEADDFFAHAKKDAEKEGKVAIIVSIDKDLKQIPGLHYNPVKEELTEVSENAARSMFWRQMLEGDSVDNIKGIKGVGKMRAKKYIPEGLSDDKSKAVVVDYYKRDHGEEWQGEYNKACDLLWIWRNIPDECPHKVL
jgi:5'-3' exonuclease